ncbi:hypothetical protein GCM10009799_14540 [Nocardiopsis rhodophaea]|uniref:Secreted protein n=1 Tax=Nocardiopsis rhodophaea TaxID=280238 RepID=A0ABN2SNY8_9ACTN
MQLRKIGTAGLATAALSGLLVVGLPTAAHAAPPVGNRTQCTHSKASESPNWYTEREYRFVSEGKWHLRNNTYVRTHTVKVDVFKFGGHVGTHTEKYDCLI